MKVFISLFTLILSLSLTAQTNTATWYRNDTSGSGIQSYQHNIASGAYSISIGNNTEASGYASTAMGMYTTASGNVSTAMGKGTLASGPWSTAIGLETTANNVASTAMGEGTLASGHWSTAMGIETEASGEASNAMGRGTTASGNWSTAMGKGTLASGPWSTAIGLETTASGTSSTAMGIQTKAIGMYSTAIGTNTTASGNASTAMGEMSVASGSLSTAAGGLTTAEDFLSFAIGVHNKTDETPNPYNFSYQNTAFVIGNGGYDSEGNYDGHLSNAFEVLFDGTTTIAGDLSINSDARLKANIISLGSTLAKLLQIDGKSYTMKKDENKKQKIGLLAQDIEKVFPELVSESNGIKTVNYQGLVPVLINALKEQQAEIDRLKTQEERLERLERLVAAMD